MKTCLLVGLCPNPNVIPVSQWEHAAAFAVVGKGSGHWLLNVLASPALADWRFVLENAVTLHRVAKQIPSFDAVIALSRVSAQVYGLPYVPHPAYWKRFHHGDEFGWIRQLRDQLFIQAGDAHRKPRPTWYKPRGHGSNPGSKSNIRGLYE